MTDTEFSIKPGDEVIVSDGYLGWFFGVVGDTYTDRLGNQGVTVHGWPYSWVKIIPETGKKATRFYSGASSNIKLNLGQ